jgi:acetyltransferase-like isoleucine patch superfamily enzyme
MDTDAKLITVEKTATQREHQWENVVTALVGWIPLSLGFKLRGHLYRKLFAKTGTFPYIQPGVELIGSHQIELGNKVVLNRGVRLNGRGENSKVILRDQVNLDLGVDIRVSLGNCHIEIGDRTSIGPFSCLAGPGNIRIGKDCLIASHVGIFANNHQFSDPKRKIREQGVTAKGIEIEDDCWLGSGVKVLDGVKIGHGSVIGGGAVVTK